MDNEDLLHPARKYFEITDSTAKCLMSPKCKHHIQPLKGVHAGNMLKHLKRWHKKEAAAVEKTRGKSKPKKRKFVSDEPLITAKFLKSSLIEGCLEMVSVNGRPFSILEDSGFKTIISPFTAAFGNSFAINEENIRSQVPVKAEAIRSKLKSDLEGRLICLKVDSAKRMTRSFLG